MSGAKAQNIVEIDPTIPVKLGWDYTLPVTDVIGFKVYRKNFVNNVASWVLIAQKTVTPTSTALDLESAIPAPYIGTYVVTAYSATLESEHSDELTLIAEVLPPTVPLAPTNLRVIQIR